MPMVIVFIRLIVVLLRSLSFSCMWGSLRSRPCSRTRLFFTPGLGLRPLATFRLCPLLLRTALRLRSLLLWTILRLRPLFLLRTALRLRSLLLLRPSLRSRSLLGLCPWLLMPVLRRRPRLWGSLWPVHLRLRTSLLCLSTISLLRPSLRSRSIPLHSTRRRSHPRQCCRKVMVHSDPPVRYSL